MFFKSDNNAQIFEVTVPRVYNGHDLTETFCYLKVEFADGTCDKSLLSLDYDEDTVTVSTAVTKRMQRVEGTARYQLSFECEAFTAQSTAFDVEISASVADAFVDNTAVAEAVFDIQDMMTSDVARIDAEIASLKEQSVTYDELLALVSEEKLVKGRRYRLTDYQFTTTAENTVSAGYPFDIILTADSDGALSEHAFAAKHEGDSHYVDCIFPLWKLKYSVYNDNIRFGWADTVNGKGVVYYLKDEWGNEAPYDFKNAKFKRTYTSGGTSTDYYAFTFNSRRGVTMANIIAGSGDLYDASVLDLDSADGSTAHDNVIAAKHEVISSPYGVKTYKTVLNDIVIMADHGSDIFGNSFDIECGAVTATGAFNGNVFGKYCFGNTFGSNCHTNVFGDYFNGNIFNDNCYKNVFASDCRNNVFGNYTINNTVGSGFVGNVLSRYCKYNVFGNGCEENVFGAASNGGNNFVRCTVGSGVKYVDISGNSAVKQVTIESGLEGSSSSQKLDLTCADLNDKAYPVSVGKDALGRIVVSWFKSNERKFCYKTSATSSTWVNGVSHLGSEGSATLYTNNWNNLSQSINFTALNAAGCDAIFFSPSSAHVQDVISKCGLFVSANGQTVTFSCEKLPTEHVVLNYFIVRGAQ